MDAIVSGQSCIPPLPCILEHTVPLEGVSFKEPEYGFDVGLGHLSQESSREEMGSQPLERQDCIQGKNKGFGARLPTLESRF